MEWCIDKAKLKPGAVIIDVFCGSATTAIAAYNKGFDFICSDFDPEIIPKAQERYADHIRQTKLITPKEMLVQMNLIEEIQA